MAKRARSSSPGTAIAAAVAVAIAGAACGGPPSPRAPRLYTESTVDVTLTPVRGLAGPQRVNFAVPLARGRLADPDQVRVLAGGAELPAARRALARYADGSVRSVQLQVELTAVTPGQVLHVRLGEAPAAPAIELVAVEATLAVPDGTRGPRVWARLPAGWLSASGVAGPLVPEDATTGAAAGAWDTVCDYERHGTRAFQPFSVMKDVWLYDRGTVFYRGHARIGDLGTLVSAYRETALYRARVTGAGAALRIGVPEAAEDLKYHYGQGLAIHYLLTGDDRFRESAEALADRAAALWSSPAYEGGEDFWTERHAGFALLAYVWAGIVTDDRAADFARIADQAVDAYLALPARYPAGWRDARARCFAHQATAHGEDYGGWGCSPWMSAILADALDAYAAEREGDRAAAARAAIVELGRFLAREGRDDRGRPYYWRGLDGAHDEPDFHDEHWGEAAYVVAMAWHWSGRREAALRQTAEALLRGLADHGRAPHLRSFNWQCRSAVATPYYLQ